MGTVPPFLLRVPTVNFSPHVHRFLPLPRLFSFLRSRRPPDPKSFGEVYPFFPPTKLLPPRMGNSFRGCPFPPFLPNFVFVFRNRRICRDPVIFFFPLFPQTAGNMLRFRNFPFPFFSNRGPSPPPLENAIFFPLSYFDSTLASESSLKDEYLKCAKSSFFPFPPQRI